MQMTELSPRMSLVARISFGIVNGLLFLALYVGYASCSFFGFTLPGVGILSEIACLGGIITCALLLTVRWNALITRWMFIAVVTLWNQTCLIFFLVSLIPFHTKH